MQKSDFYYDLPPELIAQTPAAVRDHSRLLVMDRASGALSHLHFYDVCDLLSPGDYLILNDSRVMPARLYGMREDSGSRVEFLLLRRAEGDTWEVLCGPGKKARPGHRFVFGDGRLRTEITEITEGGNRLARFAYEGDFFTLLEQIGEMPLPHYITQKPDEPGRYQTVYAKHPGSAAAPTAGLHFTPELLDRLRGRGIAIGFVTLHVGLGTFRPVKVDNITDHIMHAEHYHVPAETAAMIERTKAQGGRVIAVGTTSCRTLESAAGSGGGWAESEGWTDLFIYPGYRFAAVDGLITNFHLPESTLMMLVSAFAGYEHTMEAYRRAVAEKYRFFSFGDAMLIL